MLKISKTLAELLPEWAEPTHSGIAVSAISQDSRTVVPGTLFVARSGLKHRGVDFIEGAVADGAVAVLIDSSELSDCPNVDVPVIGISDLVSEIGPVAARFYEQPSRAMTVVGITGTNGKTSCAHFVAQAMNNIGVKTAIVGTVGNGFPGLLEKATHTTPDAIGLQKLFAELKAAGAEAVVMEVSSHALEQGRVAAVDFDYGLFTNLSRDHLDYHGSMEAYGEAKARLFKEFNLKAALINGDDSFGRKLLRDESIEARKVSVGRLFGQYHFAAYRLALHGIEAELKTPAGNFAFASKIIGEFNLDNLLLVAALLSEQGFSKAQVMESLSQLDSVPGRMQAVVAADKPLVIIDYAHTPDALEKALSAVRAHTTGTLWCVFGCGGDRDAGKRELMGRIADQLADHLVVTSDNPRTESPERIIEMIEQGICQHEPAIEADRAAAIRLAIMQASPEDVVLIAGKGHEDYQEVGTKRYPFSDLEVSMRLLGVAA
ncbi:UDP-N-acetylmuramoyl-L-alanyl-D-glutamate--2,6-diaminopimelate ligase [Neptuniibacter caesariensis]|uniref:UDP-N-acetylmuramoyl-L-alanyl-D-glutamate--2,6-diaminopimelate ligase n=1 Tax=Neptuniibacter caesariensis TaxID=207954 RepID=A0A7U8GR11_NEPCE|nr:UDP-N-acetylmuramoyl-L-alanyl-D-glutamate--2,6-diaminopimelate ligase [Neptuniibacter caesariensis]EAR59722.1 UDP-N-acetylmuramoylalanyl-D-glutamate-2, 6-diaminopimelate ligase [Oceanospirillum sp. MED92] [Neptuniibacter caesariensis]